MSSRALCEFVRVESPDERVIWRCSVCGHVTPIPLAKAPMRNCEIQHDQVQRTKRRNGVETAFLICPHRGNDVLRTINGRVAGYGCRKTNVEVYQCGMFNEPVLKHGAPPCLDTLREQVPGATGLVCQTCVVPRNLVASGGLSGELTQKVTICLTHHKRPDALRRCLASLSRVYPDVRIVLQETGGNLSWGRNRAIEQVETPYLMIAEDDYEFDDRAYLPTLIDVLESDPEVAGASGFIRQQKQTHSWYWWSNLRRFRGRLVYSRPNEERITPSGVPYLLADLLPNAGVWRREVFAACPWDEEIPIHGEHREWFWRFKQLEQWRCAGVPSVSVKHWQDRPPDYQAIRNRPQFRPVAETKIGAVLGEFRGHPPLNGRRPNVVVLGLGHANTTITTRQLGALGWNLGDADQEYAESVSVRAVNEQWDQDAAIEALAALPQPWAVKDPRFSRGMLHRWLPLLLPYRPLLLWMTKDLADVIASYERREHERPMVADLPRWLAYCEDQFIRWPWAKLRIDASQVAESCRLFVPR